MIKIQARDIEAIEEQLHDIVDKLEELEGKRSQLRADIVQNRSEAVANKELEYEANIKSIVVQAQMYVAIADLDSFEEHLDDVTTHIQHALDIFTDVLQQYQG